MNQIIDNLIDEIKKQYPKLNIKKYMVKSNLAIFINCNIDNPNFDT